MDLKAHLTRQAAFSYATFGPGERTQGVLDHMQKEIEEVRAVYDSDDDDDGGDIGRNLDAAEEWVDLVILALDGLTRTLRHTGYSKVLTNPEIAARACELIERKQSKNEMRTWPDWRTAAPGKAIEHDRSGE